jgi:hypothetical protein
MAIRRIQVGGVSRDIYDARIDAIDSSLSTSSVNPVQNAAIGTEFSKVAYMGEAGDSVEIPDFDPASDTVWNKEQTLSSAQQAQARANIGIDLSLYQTVGNLVTSISSSSTVSQYPSAKCVYDIIGDIETLLAAL